jgi:hypothetical protein
VLDSSRSLPFDVLGTVVGETDEEVEGAVVGCMLVACSRRFFFSYSSLKAVSTDKRVNAGGQIPDLVLGDIQRAITELCVSRQVIQSPNRNVRLRGRSGRCLDGLWMGERVDCSRRFAWQNDFHFCLAAGIPPGHCTAQGGEDARNGRARSRNKLASRR